MTVGVPVVVYVLNFEEPWCKAYGVKKTMETVNR